MAGSNAKLMACLAADVGLGMTHTFNTSQPKPRQPIGTFPAAGSLIGGASTTSLSSAAVATAAAAAATAGAEAPGSEATLPAVQDARRSSLLRRRMEAKQQADVTVVARDAQQTAAGERLPWLSSTPDLSVHLLPAFHGRNRSAFVTFNVARVPSNRSSGATFRWKAFAPRVFHALRAHSRAFRVQASVPVEQAYLPFFQFASQTFHISKTSGKSSSMFLMPDPTASAGTCTSSTVSTMANAGAVTAAVATSADAGVPLMSDDGQARDSSEVQISAASLPSVIETDRSSVVSSPDTLLSADHRAGAPESSSTAPAALPPGFLLKTISREESKVLRDILPAYYAHLRSNPNSLLPLFLGHWYYKVGRSKVYLVLLVNQFHTPLPIDLRYDLKGSTVNRVTPENQRSTPGITLKDVDFTQAGEPLHLGSRRGNFLDQVKADVTFLQDQWLMDYSLLAGIHRVRVRHTETPAAALMRVVDDAAQASGIPSDPVPDCIYFLGIIDILQVYNMRKRMAHWFKAVRYNRRTISTVDPDMYSRRFVEFLSQHTT